MAYPDGGDQLAFDTNTHTHADSYSNAHTNAYSNTHTYTHADSDPYTDSNTNADTHADPDSDSNSNSHPNANAYPHADPYPHAGTDTQALPTPGCIATYADSHSHSHAYPDPNAHAHAHAHSNADSHTNTDSHTDAYPDPDAHADSLATSDTHPNSNTHGHTSARHDTRTLHGSLADAGDEACSNACADATRHTSTDPRRHSGRRRSPTLISGRGCNGPAGATPRALQSHSVAGSCRYTTTHSASSGAITIGRPDGDSPADSRGARHAEADGTLCGVERWKHAACEEPHRCDCVLHRERLRGLTGVAVREPSVAAAGGAG